MATKQIIALHGTVRATVNYRNGTQAKRGFPYYPGAVNEKHAIAKAHDWANLKMKEESPK